MRWQSLLWAVVIAVGAGLCSGITLHLLGIAWRRLIGDALFVEGALLLVIAGLLDMGRSITFAHIRALPRIGDPPPSLRARGRTLLLVTVGLLLCLEGVLLVRLFAKAQG